MTQNMKDTRQLSTARKAVAKIKVMTRQQLRHYWQSRGIDPAKVRVMRNPSGPMRIV